MDWIGKSTSCGQNKGLGSLNMIYDKRPLQKEFNDLTSFNVLHIYLYRRLLFLVLTVKICRVGRVGRRAEKQTGKKIKKLIVYFTLLPRGLNRPITINFDKVGSSSI